MKLDKYHYHELLHATNMLMEMCETHLLEHHAGKLYKDDIGEICWKLSQLYGKVSIDSDELFGDLGNLCGDEWLKTGKP